MISEVEALKTQHQTPTPVAPAVIQVQLMGHSKPQRTIVYGMSFLPNKGLHWVPKEQCTPHKHAGSLCCDQLTYFAQAGARLHRRKLLWGITLWVHQSLQVRQESCERGLQGCRPQHQALC